MRIKGAVAVVTGASGGIGQATALSLARRGAAVALVARGEEGLERVAGEVRRIGGRALVVACDVTDADAVERAHTRVREALGPVDIVVNAAGFGIWKPFLEITAGEHAGMMNTMYWGAHHWIRSVLPDMLARKRGHVVNVSAGSGQFGLSVTSGYSAAAFALRGFSEALHRELLGRRVRVSCVCPGSVRTGFWDAARTPQATIPPLVRFAPKLSPEAVARNIGYCIRLGLSVRTMPIFVAVLARANALWIRFGDLILWKWFVPAVVLLLALRVLLF
ncbi:MAG: SDR family NAD(P)-dependent oxidoreductase [Gemmatimonadetes bacterium]|nr:SDR family NAD(P)-dependent oxidoreductase [Gemmatimonadota bacterium]